MTWSIVLLTRARSRKTLRQRGSSESVTSVPPMPRVSQRLSRSPSVGPETDVSSIVLTTLRQEVQKKDSYIQHLQTELHRMQKMMSDQERRLQAQEGRRDSVSFRPDFREDAPIKKKHRQQATPQQTKKDRYVSYLPTTPIANNLYKLTTMSIARNQAARSAAATKPPLEEIGLPTTSNRTNEPVGTTIGFRDRDRMPGSVVSGLTLGSTLNESIVGTGDIDQTIHKNEHARTTRMETIEPKRAKLETVVSFAAESSFTPRKMLRPQPSFSVLDQYGSFASNNEAGGDRLSVSERTIETIGKNHHHRHESARAQSLPAAKPNRMKHEYHPPAPLDSPPNMPEQESTSEARQPQSIPDIPFRFTRQRQTKRSSRNRAPSDGDVHIDAPKADGANPRNLRVSSRRFVNFPREMSLAKLEQSGKHLVSDLNSGPDEWTSSSTVAGARAEAEAAERTERGDGERGGSDGSIVSPHGEETSPSRHLQHLASTGLTPSLKQVQDRPLRDAKGRKGQYSGALSQNSQLPEGYGTIVYQRSVRCLQDQTQPQQVHLQQHYGSYTGEWHSGEFHGHGILVLTSDDQYTGAFLNGQKHGTGTYRFHDGRVFDGQFQDNAMKDGTMEFANGTKYIGLFANHKRHGFGTYFFDASERTYYEGQWENDQVHGRGRMQWSDGSHYNGDWKNGQMDGFGTHFNEDGAIEHQGRWIQGLPVEEDDINGVT